MYSTVNGGGTTKAYLNCGQYVRSLACCGRRLFTSKNSYGYLDSVFSHYYHSFDKIGASQLDTPVLLWIVSNYIHMRKQ